MCRRAPTEAAIEAHTTDGSAAQRPWVREVEGDWAGGSAEIEFPSEDESTGFVCLVWRAPRYADFQSKLARKILWLYLSDSAGARQHRHSRCFHRPTHTGAGEDHGIDHNKNWLIFPNDSTFLRSHYLHPHPYTSAPTKRWGGCLQLNVER
eukprot:COSAG01_NODE_4221_length_5227_cov_3.990445_2_plen_151_part_00